MINILKSFLLGATILFVSLALVGGAIWLYQWIMTSILGKQIVGNGLLVLVVVAFVYASYRLGESIRAYF
jgi:hypothetical protein